MLLYWSMFTLGFLAGSILAYVIFAPKNPQEDPDYEYTPNKSFLPPLAPSQLPLIKSVSSQTPHSDTTFLKNELKQEIALPQIAKGQKDLFLTSKSFAEVSKKILRVN